MMGTGTLPLRAILHTCASRVVTKSGDQRKDYEIQDLIENRCRYQTSV